MITIATEAARRAGEILIENYGRASLKIETKSDADYVTEVDRAAEQIIHSTIVEACPDHGFLMEESGRIDAESPYVWVVDPLDGTTNYIHRFPFFAISIALMREGDVVLGLVYDPLRQELFSAEKGDGARLNGMGVKVSKKTELGGALLATGFPFRVEQHVDAYMDLFKDTFRASGDVRRAGAAALDLAYVACGRTDGFWELGLAAWDVAAGSLLVEEAGGVVCDFHGGRDYVFGGDIVATNAGLQEQLICRTRKHFSERPV